MPRSVDESWIYDRRVNEGSRNIGFTADIAEQLIHGRLKPVPLEHVEEAVLNEREEREAARRKHWEKVQAEIAAIDAVIVEEQLEEMREVRRKVLMESEMTLRYDEFGNRRTDGLDESSRTT